MRQFLQALTNLDAKAWRTIAVSFVLFGGVGLVFVLGAPLVGVHGTKDIERWMGVGAAGPWAPFVAIAAFTLLAFLGAPQVLLIAVAVVVFGGWEGFVYSWLGTEVSALVGFWLGRRFGARLLNEYAGKGVRQFTDLVGRNGLAASFVVRLVPSAPFIVVNMAAGATPMSVWAFIGGCAIGSLPKIALTAFAGHAVVGAISGKGGRHWWSLALAAALWIGTGLLAREWIKRREAARAGPPPSDA